MPDSLYIHIPFCVRKCSYCDFFSVPYDELTAHEYTDALCRELSIKRRFARKLKTVYIGGGTPSLLPDKCFVELFECLKDSFSLSPSHEITVEANPGTIVESKISSLVSLGVNRLSVGVQSFNDNELKTLGRLHSAVEAITSVKAIKKAGIENVSVDLMYGIPGQTMDTWKASLSKAIELSPAHISAYELTLEKNTPLHKMANPRQPASAKKHQGGLPDVIKMPDEELTIAMYNYAIAYLKNTGYDHYEISNFGLPGFRCLHNLNYWYRGEYLAAGAGAHSFISGVRSRNINNVRRYIEDLNVGIIPESEAIGLSAKEALREFVFLGLRKTDGLSMNELLLLGNGDIGECHNLVEASRELIDEGYLEIRNGHLRLTVKGIIISNSIIVTLFQKLGL